MSKSIFKGKTVAIVCPAPHVAEMEQAEKINSFDLVVRINNAFPLTPEVERCTGSRCDVLYVPRRAPVRPEWERITEIRVHSNSLWNPDSALPTYRQFKDKVVICNPRDERRWWESVGSNPNTGFIALLDALEDGAKHVYVTGMTFFRGTGSLYHAGHIPYEAAVQEKLHKRQGNVRNHNQENQIRFFKRYLWDYVEIDSVMEKILQEEKDQ